MPKLPSRKAGFLRKIVGKKAKELKENKTESKDTPADEAKEGE